MSPVADFTKYQPPGVYVSETAGGVAVGGFGQDVTIALIGSALGINSFTEQFTLTGTVAQQFAYDEIIGTPTVFGLDTGVTYTANTDYVVTIVPSPASVSIARNLNSVVEETVTGLTGTTPVKLANPLYVEDGTVVVTSADGQTVYVEDEDYIINYSSGTIERYGTDIPEATPIKVSYDWCGIKSGHNVAVTYSYEPEDYSNVYLFTDYDSVARFYGEPMDENGDVQSELSFGAYFAFLNGAAQVYTVAVESDNGSPNILQWEDAIAKLEGVTDVDYVVPVSGDPQVHALVLSHINAMYVNNLERRALLGRDGSSTPVTSATLISAAQGYDNERVCLLSPATIGYFNPVVNAQETIGAHYVACALAGVASTVAPFVPLTNKYIYGFSGMSETRSKAVKNRESIGGLMVLEDISGSIRVRHGLTTDVSTVESRENSVVFAKDRMIQRLRTNYDSIIGTPITSDTPVIVKSLTIGTLERLRSSGYIYSYTDVKVRQSTFDPTLIEVKYQYKPTYPLNYVYIQFAIDLTSGVITTV